ncbi:hypothetical protein VE03_02584 [Pseudogymnoascus sp. 23342-1-I1]|nr:hypothetical protein VE03_02584 [Pseudogymnoascus sp. 23342-1-I1]
MEWADGESLHWSDTSPTSLSHRQKIIHAIADATLDLLQIQKPGDSAKEYVTSRINQKIERALSGKYAGGGVEGCHKQLDLLDEFWDPDLDTAPHVLVHGDLSVNNIIVNGNSDVEKIIDLGWSDMVPLQFAAVYPRFLTYQPSQVCLEKGDVVSFDWSVKYTSIMMRDRAFYLNCIKRRAYSEGGIALDFYKALDRPGESRRYWWFRAVHQLDAHKAMVACDWDPGYTADVNNPKLNSNSNSMAHVGLYLVNL